MVGGDKEKSVCVLESFVEELKLFGEFLKMFLGFG